MTDNLQFDSLEEKRLATPRLIIITTVFLVVGLIGVTAGLYALMVGHQYAYNVSRDIPWGIIISSFIFLALSATGLCVLSAISHRYGVGPLAPLGNRAVYLAIVTVVAGFVLFASSLETPWRLLLYNATSPSLTSNIWWMCTLYGIMSGCLFLKFSFFVTRRFGMGIAIGVVGAVAGVGANNNLGGLFTLASDPPIWYGPQLLVLFLASAVMSGAALIIIFTNLAYKIRRQKIMSETAEALHGIGTILALTIAILLVVTVARFTSIFSEGDPEPGRVTALLLLKGPLAFNFWVLENLVGLVAPLIILVATKVKNLNAITLASCLALVGGFFQRFDLVVSGELIPKFIGWDNALVNQHYFPSFPEFLVVLGGFGLVGAGFLLGERFIGRIFSLLP